jgi:hypothetical protein
VLTEFNAMKGGIEILQKEFRRMKVRVVDGTDRTVNAQYEASVGIQIPLKKRVSYS